MSRLIAYLCNNTTLTPVAMRVVADSVDLGEPSDSGGFGLGWVQGGQTLLRTAPRPGKNAAAFLDLMSDIPSRSMIAHVRGGDEGLAGTLDLQPFRFRRWVFAHAGEQVELAAARQGLLAEVPSFVARNVKGTTSSEVFGHVFMGKLHRSNILDAHSDPKACGSAMAAAIRDVQIGAAVASFGSVAVSARTLVAGQTGHPMFVRVLRGLSHVSEEPLFAGHKPKATSHPTFRAVFVTDAPVSGSEWQEIPDGQVMWVDGEWNLCFAPIAEA